MNISEQIKELEIKSERYENTKTKIEAIMNRLKLVKDEIESIIDANDINTQIQKHSKG